MTRSGALRASFLAILFLVSPTAAAESAAVGWIWFPDRGIFTTPLADQRQPRTHVTWQAYRRGDQDISIGSVGYGMEWGLGERRTGQSAVQVGVDGAVFAIFNLDSPSMDLINADYFVGIPLDLRRGAWSIRLRPFHLSSHLGDEFLLYPQPREPVERINVSFEAVEVLASWESHRWRIYAGGFSAVRSTDGVLEDRLQGGIEFRSARFGSMGARWIAAVDVQESLDAASGTDLSVKAGVEIIPSRGDNGVQLLLEYYDGRAPHGQFAREEAVHYLGAGIVFVF